MTKTKVEYAVQMLFEGQWSERAQYLKDDCLKNARLSLTEWKRYEPRRKFRIIQITYKERVVK